jgi:hypothetical protein
MDQTTWLVLVGLAAGTTALTLLGLLGELELLGLSLGTVLWSIVSQQAFAIEIYSGGQLVATEAYVSVAIVALIVAIVHLVLSIEAASVVVRDRGVLFDV